LFVCYLFIYLFIYSFIHSFIHSFIYSFIYFFVILYHFIKTDYSTRLAIITMLILRVLAETKMKAWLLIALGVLLCAYLIASNPTGETGNPNAAALRGGLGNSNPAVQRPSTGAIVNANAAANSAPGNANAAANSASPGATGNANPAALPANTGAPGNANAAVQSAPNKIATHAGTQEKNI
jgi:hypothetical protein